MLEKKKGLGQNVFIALEGLSGSGKTTIGKLLAKEIGAEFYRTPAPIFASIREEVNRNADPTARYFFYLAGVIQASVEISQLLKSRPVVCDRYILTTICYYRVLGVKIEIPDSLLKPLLKPDYTFLIVCSEEKRIKRLELTHHNNIAEREAPEQKLLAEYQKYHLIEIDSSIDDPAIAVKSILSFLRE